MIAIAERVAGAVDDARRGDRNPDQLHAPHRETCKTKQRDEDHQRNAHALPRVLAVKIALNPIVWRAVPVAREGVEIFGFFAVHIHAVTQHAQVAVNHRTVRVVNRVAFGVMFTMNGDPFFGHHAGGQPQPHAEKMRNNRMQIKRAMRLRPMQKNRNGCDGDMAQRQHRQHIAPPRQINRALRN